LGISYPNTTHGDKSESKYFSSPLDVLSVSLSESAIKGAISYVAINNGLDPEILLSVAQCESGFKVDAVGDSGKAYGLFQFHKPTFDGFCRGDYYSAKDQIVCAGEMFANHQESHWTCYKKLYGW